MSCCPKQSVSETSAVPVSVLLCVLSSHSASSLVDDENTADTHLCFWLSLLLADSLYRSTAGFGSHISVVFFDRWLCISTEWQMISVDLICLYKNPLSHVALCSKAVQGDSLTVSSYSCSPVVNFSLWSEIDVYEYQSRCPEITGTHATNYCCHLWPVEFLWLALGLIFLNVSWLFTDHLMLWNSPSFT